MKNFIKKIFSDYFRTKENEYSQAYLWYKTYYSKYPEYEKTLSFKLANLANETSKLFGILAKVFE